MANVGDDDIVTFPAITNYVWGNDRQRARVWTVEPAAVRKL